MAAPALPIETFSMAKVRHYFLLVDQPGHEKSMDT